jgi:tellurite resistance protein
MRHDSFHDREQAEENVYFAQRDARLIERIRARAQLGEIAAALADKLHVDNPDVLQRIVELGITHETAAAFLLLPLVDVAWSDGHVSPAEYDAVVRIASEGGVPHDSPDMAQLRQWLAQAPPLAVVELALTAIKIGLSVLPLDERRQRVDAVMKACEDVARASSGIGRVPSMAGDVSHEEWSALGRIKARLMI